MVIDVDTHRDPQGFPVDHPLDALRQDHDIVRRLFERYHEMPQAQDERQDIAYEILLRLDRHMELEETVFYPRVRSVDAELVQLCEAAHRQVRQCMKPIRSMAGGARKSTALLELASIFDAYVDVEEKRLFPLVVQSGVDLVGLGADMKAFELSQIAAEAPALPSGKRLAGAGHAGAAQGGSARQ
jgi:hemerythrin superfamily protein